MMVDTPPPDGDHGGGGTTGRTQQQRRRTNSPRTTMLTMRTVTSFLAGMIFTMTFVGFLHPIVTPDVRLGPTNRHNNAGLYSYPPPSTTPASFLRLPTLPPSSSASASGPAAVATSNSPWKSSHREGAVGATAAAVDGIGSDRTLQVLLLDVHLEGNLGDEMETLPLLRFLKGGAVGGHAGVTVTAVVSEWLEGGPDRQLSFRSVREHALLDRIWTWSDVARGRQGDDGEDAAAVDLDSAFDVTILAPGPWKLCQLPWSHRHHRVDVLFGGSVMDGDGGDNEVDTMKDATSNANVSNSSNPSDTCSLRQRLQAWNPELIAVREPLSYRRLQALQGGGDRAASWWGHPSTHSHDSKPSVVLSGDLSHSFPLIQSSYDFWEKAYAGRYHNTSIIFPRANNAKNSIEVKGRTVVLDAWTPQYGKGGDHVDDSQNKVVLPGSQVVFATSSAIEDATMFVDWKYQYYDRFKEDQFVVCETVEQLFGLISHARHVYSDRYHPAVAAHRLGVDFTILKYEQEQTKLAGLHELVYGRGDGKDMKYPADAVANELNADAFIELQRILEAKVAKKYGDGL